MTVAAEQGGAGAARAERVALVLGSSDFGGGFERLIRVPDELRMMKAVLAETAGYAIHPDSRLNPSKTELEGSFRRAVRGDGATPPPDVLLFYYSGHAFENSRGTLTIAAADSHKDADETLFEVDALFKVLTATRRPRPREVVILLDACHAGLAVAHLEKRVGEERVRGTPLPVLTAIGAIDRLREARQLQFVDSFAAALRTTVAGDEEKYLPMARLCTELTVRMKQLDGDEGPPLPEPLQAAEESRAFLNPRYLPRTRLRRPLEATESSGWAFCGRAAAVDAVVSHLTDGAGEALFVTGAAGSGKSVLLDWIHTGSRGGRPLPSGPGAPGPAPRNCLDTLVDVRGTTLDGVLWKLDAQYPVHDSDELTAQTLLDAVARAAEQRPLRLCFDSLDAARDPHELYATLLAPLAALDNVGVVLAGSSVPSGFTGRVADLAGPEFFAAQDVAALVAHVLRHRAGTRWGHENQQTVDDIAHKTAQAAGRSWLRAYLFAVSFSSEDPADARLQADKTTADLFLEQLGSLAEDEDDPRWAPDLLLPVALAQGEGLPADGLLWTAVAEAVTGRSVPPAELALLQDKAREILAAPEGGMHGHGWRFQGSAQAEYLVRDRGEATAHAAFVDAMTGRLPRRASDDSPDWTAADRYTREHFAHHARLAGLLRGYLDDPEFLLMMNAEALHRALTLTQEDARDPVAHVRRLCTELRRADRTDGNTLSRVALLAQVHGLSGLARRAAEAANGWQPSLTYRQGPVRTVHCLPGGGEVLLDDEGDVQLRTGTAWRSVGLPLRRGVVTTTSLIDAGGPALFAGEVTGRAWVQRLDQPDACQVFDDLELDCELVACRLTEAGLLFAGTEGWQWRADGTTGPVVPRRDLRLGGATAAVADGVPHVAARTAREVCVWRADGTFLHSYRPDQRRALTAIASDHEGVYTGAGDGTVQWTSWDGAWTEDVTRHGSPVAQLRVHADADGPLLVSAGSKGDIRLTPLPGSTGTPYEVVLGLNVSSVDVDSSADIGAQQRLVVGTSAGVVRIAR